MKNKNIRQNIIKEKQKKVKLEKNLPNYRVKEPKDLKRKMRNWLVKQGKRNENKTK